MKLHSVWVPLLSALSTLLQISCAGDNAGELRELRPVTIAGNAGPTVSLEYRPAKSLGVNVYGHSASNELNSGDFNLAKLLWDKLEESSRNFKNEGTDLGVAASFYPIESSAFRIGLGFEQHNSRVSFDSNTTYLDQYGFLETTRVSYTQKSNYLSVPLGWSWIWSSGFSFSIDYGPRFRISRSIHWENKGETRVDDIFRDSYANQKEDDKNVQFGGSGGFGYSF